MAKFDKLSLFLRLAVGIIILLLVILKIGLDKLTAALLRINPLFIPLILAVYFVSFFIGVINIKIFADCIKRLSFKTLFKFYSVSWAIGMFVPGKIGEFSIVFLLKNEGFSIAEGTVISLLDKVITFLVLAALAAIGFFIYFPAREAFTLLAIMALVFILLVFFLLTPFGRGLIKRFILRKQEKLFKGFYKTLRFFLLERTMLVGANFAITLIKWATNAAVTYILFLSMGSHVSFIHTLLISSAAVILTLVPISLAGLGLREGAMVFLFARIGVQPEIVLSVALMYTAINYALAVVFLAAFSQKSAIR